MAAHEKAKEAADTNVRCKILGGKTHLLRGKRTFIKKTVVVFLCPSPRVSVSQPVLVPVYLPEEQSLRICICAAVAGAVFVSTLASVNSNSYYCRRRLSWLVYFCCFFFAACYQHLGSGVPPKPCSHPRPYPFVYVGVLCPFLRSFVFIFIIYHIFFRPRLM